MKDCRQDLEKMEDLLPEMKCGECNEMLSQPEYKCVRCQLEMVYFVREV